MKDTHLGYAFYLSDKNYYIHLTDYSGLYPKLLFLYKECNPIVCFDVDLEDI